LTLFHPSRSVTVRAGRFRSKASNTPFEGWKLRGRPVVTIVGGRVLTDLPKS
jgi:dihydroorotase